jgi:hypothetical protein
MHKKFTSTRFRAMQGGRLLSALVLPKRTTSAKCRSAFQRELYAEIAAFDRYTFFLTETKEDNIAKA